MSRRHTLTDIYALYDQWLQPSTFACAKGCATCCTRSVTLTTLEGELVHDYLCRQRPDLLPLIDSLPSGVPTPSTTTNQFAAACMRGEDLADESGNWDLSPCLFLDQGCCSIYPVRPFMCRSFGSQVRCDLGGEAVADPLFLTMNTTVMQCIEHLDRGRPWGNMNRLLPAIAAGSASENTAPGLPVSQGVPGFLLLPEEEAFLREMLQDLCRLIDLR